MATINPTVVELQSDTNNIKDGSAFRITWAAVGESDTVTPVRVPHFADKTFQVLGTFGSATAKVDGSCDGGTTYFDLRNSSHTAISMTSAGGDAILENVEYIKPVYSGGTAQSLTFVLVVRMNNPLRN